MKKVLTIAGSDCSGGAGVQADLKTFSAHGVYGMSVIAAVVAENTCRVLDVQEITPEMIRKQMDAVFEDVEVDAGSRLACSRLLHAWRAVVAGLKTYRPRHIVVDPVMYAKNGSPLMEPSSIGCLIREVVPLAEVLTPNIPEAESITGMTIERLSDMERAAVRIRSMGAGRSWLRADMPAERPSTSCSTENRSIAFPANESGRRTPTARAARFLRRSPPGSPGLHGGRSGEAGEGIRTGATTRPVHRSWKWADESLLFPVQREISQEAQHAD